MKQRMEDFEETKLNVVKINRSSFDPDFYANI